MHNTDQLEASQRANAFWNIILNRDESGPDARGRDQQFRDELLLVVSQPVSVSEAPYKPFQ